MLAVLALALALPAPALSQSARPTVTTGGTAGLTPSSVTVLGRVDPNGAQTTYFFQYGPTPLYGAATPELVAGSGTAAINVVAGLAGLAPATRYHYRLVARNRHGLVMGADRTFRTRNQPLGLTLAATPNPVALDRPTILAGTLSGTGNAGRPIVLQANPFPYTQGFVTIANPQLTNAQGAFAFPLLSVPRNSQFRVLIPDRPQVASPIVLVSVAVRVSTNVSSRRVRPGGRVRFFGRVTPARPGARMAIQRLRGRRWVTVAGMLTRRASSRHSRYGKTIRIRRGGRYRVFVEVVDGSFVSSAGRTVTISRRR
jgi:hypothetical protein